MILGGQPRAKLINGVHSGIDLAGLGFLSWVHCREDFSKCGIADDLHIDVAFAMVVLAGEGTIDQSNSNALF